MIYRPDPDGAFFEDWSEWADLGGGCWSYPPSRRNTPRYSCHLQMRAMAIDAPGFEIRTNTSLRTHNLLMGAGAVQAFRRPFVEPRMWYFVPAGRWRDLRAVLPAVKADNQRRASLGRL